MKSSILGGALLVVGLLSLQTLADDKPASEEAPKFSATCCVAGKPALEKCFVERHGKKFYFCCGECQKAFKENPAKYSHAAHCQLLETKQVTQVCCPISGHAVDPAVTVEINGAKVGLCCKNCLAKVEKASKEEQLKLCFGEFLKSYTLQTACPVSGKPIDVSKSLKHDGKTLYFCCDKCLKKFESDPKAYTSKLPQTSK